MSEFKGEERRGDKRDDHDVLTRIDANLSNFMIRFAEHVEKDEQTFEKIDARTSRLEKFFYASLGAGVLIEFIIKVYK